MDSLMVQLRVLGPTDRANYSRMKEGRYYDMGVGVHAQVLIDGSVVIEGAVDPDRLDAFVIAVEALTEDMDVFFRDGEHHADMNREGWGQRWLEGAIYRLRQAISKSLDTAVERLAERHEQMRRYK